MKYFSIVIILFVFLINGCMYNESLNWNQVQDVGGLRIDDIQMTDNQYFIPIYCNVSGIEKVSVDPKTMNSGIVFKEYKYLINDTKILLNILVTIPSNEYKNAASTNSGIYIKKSSIKPGKYKVYYMNNDKSLVYIKEIIFHQ
jgi:hypothetical protein